MSADRKLALPCSADTSITAVSKWISGRFTLLICNDIAPLHVRGASIVPAPSTASRSILPERESSGKNKNLFNDSAAMFCAATFIFPVNEELVSVNAADVDNWPPPIAQSSLSPSVLSSMREASMFKRRICSWSLRTKSRRTRFLFA